MHFIKKPLPNRPGIYASIYSICILYIYVHAYEQQTAFLQKNQNHNDEEGIQAKIKDDKDEIVILYVYSVYIHTFIKCRIMPSPTVSWESSGTPHSRVHRRSGKIDGWMVLDA